MELMPQEIQVWYVLPAIRKELAKSMINDYKLKQNKAASLLGLTEAAVCQYMKSKRASEVILDSKIKSEIKKSAKRIIEKKSSTMEETQRLINLANVQNVVCKMHKKNNDKIGRCKICFSKGG